MLWVSNKPLSAKCLIFVLFRSLIDCRSTSGHIRAEDWQWEPVSNDGGNAIYRAVMAIRYRFGFRQIVSLPSLPASALVLIWIWITPEKQLALNHFSYHDIKLQFIFILINFYIEMSLNDVILFNIRANDS